MQRISNKSNEALPKCSISDEDISQPKHPFYNQEQYNYSGSFNSSLVNMDLDLTQNPGQFITE